MSINPAGERRICRHEQAQAPGEPVAVDMQDAEARMEAIEDVRAFNAGRVNRTMPVTQDTLKRSLATRARNARKREDGSLIENPTLNRILRDALPERVY